MNEYDSAPLLSEMRKNYKRMCLFLSERIHGRETLGRGDGERWKNIQ